MRAVIENTTTERRTSPRCIFSKAASTSPMPMVSDTKASRSKRPCRYRSTSIGKSRLGRQSPYQEDFSAPPRPNTSISGRVISMVGFGTPTSTTVPARSRASKACWKTAGWPTASMATSTPKPPVSSLIAATGSVSPELTVCVAPMPSAHSSLRSSMSTAMIFAAPASSAPAMAASPTPPQPNTATVSPRPHAAGVDRRADAGHDAAAQQAGGGRRGGRVDLGALPGVDQRLLGERADAQRRGRARCRRPASSSARRCGCRSSTSGLPLAQARQVPQTARQLRITKSPTATFGDALADRGDHAGGLVAEQERELVVDPALAVVQVGVADPAGLHIDDRLARTRVGDDDRLET